VGNLGRKVPGVGQAADAIYDTFAPVGRGLKAMFSPEAMGQIGAREQEFAAPLYRDLQNADVAARENYLGVVNKLGPEEAAAGGLNPVRSIVEGTAPGPMMPGAQAGAEYVTKRGDEMLNTERYWGKEVKESELGYMHRQQLPISSEDRLAKASPFKDRAEILQGIPTDTLEKAIRDPRLLGPGRVPLTDAAEILRTEYGIKDKLSAGAQDVISAMSSADVAAEKATRATKVADYIASRSPERLEKGLYVAPEISQLARERSSSRFVATAQHTYKNAATFATSAEEAGPGAKKLMDVLSEAGLRHNDANGGVTARMMEFLQAAGKNPVALKDMYLPSDVADALTRLAKPFTTQEALQPLIELYDKGLQYWKTAMISMPATQGRNWLSTLWQNTVNGGFTNPVQGIESMVDARRLLKGEVIKDAANLMPQLKGMTAEQATRALGDSAWARRLTGGHVQDLGPEGAKDMLAGIPGFMPRRGVLGELGSAAKEAVTGWGSIGDPTQFGPFKAMRRVGNEVESTGRLAGWIGLLRQGYDADVAAAKVMASHVDYQALTAFERNVMKRVIPFYAFARGNIPYQLEQLAMSPGGLTAQTVRAATDIRRDSEGIMPDYLGQGLAVPLGKNEDGSQKILSSIGLPFEQPLDVLDFGANPVTRTLQKLASQLTPIVKAPLEQLSGTQMYSGRHLKDVDSPLGRLFGMAPASGGPAPSPNLLMDQLLMNSPVSRLITTGRQFTDERKWADPYSMPLQALTGTRITNIDLEKQQRTQARSIIEQLYGDSPRISQMMNLYVKPEDVPNLTPQEMQAMQLYKVLTRKKAS
jgi:hypothetical protein